MPKAAARRKPAKRKPRKPTATLAPRTKKAEPAGSRSGGLVLMSQRQAGVRVTEETALTLGAVYACVKVITEDIAGLPWHVLEQRTGGGTTDRPEDPADWILHTQPNPETPAFQWREAITAHALTWGNGYAEIERDMGGRPIWLWLITPDRVRPERFQGRIIYDVSNPTGPNTVLEMNDMYHLRGLGFDGLQGYSVIQMAARSIGAGIALDQATSDLFGNDSTPGGLLEHPNRLSDPARKNLRESWNAMHQGPGNRRKVAILEEGLTWKQTGLPPDDTKLIEQRQFTPADICRWFRVSPVKIQDLLRATFSNIEELAIWHVTDTLMPWVRRLETEANIKLFGRTNRGKRFTKLNLSALLRGDQAARWAAYEAGFRSGAYSVNDILELEDRNPIGPDGDKRFVPVNMQLLEKAGEEPPKPTQPPGNPTGPSGNPSDPNADPSQPNDMPMEPAPKPALSAEPIRAALLPVFEDACRRLLHAEYERAREGFRGGAERLEAWYDKIRVKQTGLVRNQLRPAAVSFALARGMQPEMIEAALGQYADRHMEGFKERLVTALAKPDSIPGWENHASEMAATLIDRLSTAVEVAR